MSVSYSLDEVARTSDDAAVRARFNAATLTALRVLSIIALIAGFAHFAEASTAFRVVLGGASFLLAAITVMAARKNATFRLARFVRERARGVAIAFVIAQAALLIVHNASAGSEAMVAIGTVLPFLVIFYRLLPAEHVLLHSALASVSSITAMAIPVKQISVMEMMMPPLIVNAAFLMVALLISRRMRRSIVAEWSERRASAREQVRMRDELRYARELQLSMLPASPPRLDWAEISSTSIPATEVGGDYYDYFAGSDSVALVCGDVAGHGMASGLVLSAVRSGFTLLRQSLHDPAAVLQRLHDLVAHTTGRRMLVTVLVVRLDRPTRRAIIASAGHPPVVVRRADGSVTTIDLYAPPLGVRLPVDIPQRQLEFAAGDVFVLHTDGLYETRDAADEVYGLERLERIVAEHGGVSAQALRDAIVRDVTAFRGSREQDDDVTVVVCKITR